MALLKRFERAQDSTEIFVQVMDYILEREHDKAVNGFQTRCKKEFPEFQDWDKVYTIDEQIVRLAYHLVLQSTEYSNYPVSLPEELSVEYAKGMESFLRDHPFVHTFEQRGELYEMVKPEYQKPIDRATYEATIGFFDSLLRMLHPFMPFISEELWQHIGDRREGESIMYASMPVAGEIDTDLLDKVERAKEIVNGVRGVRAQRNIPNRELLTLLAINETIDLADVISKLAMLEKVDTATEKDPAAASFLVGTTEFNIPLLNNIDVEAEKAKITKEIDYYEGFKKSVEKKLSNERFVANAPAAVVEGERKKLADADSKLATLRATLAALA